VHTGDAAQTVAQSTTNADISGRDLVANNSAVVASYVKISWTVMRLASRIIHINGEAVQLLYGIAGKQRPAVISRVLSDSLQGFFVVVIISCWRNDVVIMR